MKAVKGPIQIEQLEELLAADEREILSILGAAVISSQTPLEIVAAGRRGDFYQSPPSVLGPQAPLRHKGLERIAQGFLQKWATQLRKAVCENTALKNAQKARGRKELDVFVATIVASITSHIPELAGFTVLLNILGVLIVRSGVNAFCEQTLPKK